MALIGHWPLNGNLNDYSNVIGMLNNKGANIHDDGKIGKCYNTTESYQKLDKTYDKSMNNMGEITICCFVKIENTQITERATVVQAFGCYISIDSRFKFSSWIYGIQGSYVETDEILNRNKWYHLTLKLQDGIVYKYIDGILVQTYNGTGKKISSNDKNIHIFAENGSRQLIGKINDIRIYDEALSDKEIYDISKCKVIHYPFNNNFEITHNMCKNGNFRNGISNWSHSNGDNYMISGIFFGKTALRLSKPTTAGFFGLRQNINVNILQNTKYTIQLKYYATKRPTQNIRFYIPEYKLSDNTLISHRHYISINTNIELNKWVTLSTTFTSSSEPSKLTSMNLDWHNLETPSDEHIYVTDFKLEESDYVKEYTEYNTNGEIYDISSFKNNTRVEISKSPYWKDDNSTTNGYCKFNSNNKNIIVEQNVIESIFRNNEFTISLWYMTSNLVATTEVFSSRRDGLCCGFRIHNDGGNIRLNLVKYTIVDQYVTTNVKYENNRWYNIVVVQNSTCVKYYIDGNLVGTYNSNLLFTNINNSLELNGVGVYSINDVNISDFRIYANELSQSDISNIYNEKLNIDNKSNVLVNSISEHSNLVKDVSDSDFWNYKPTSGSIVWGVENKYIPNENALLINSHSSSHHGHSFKLPIICDKKYRFKCRVKTSGNQVYGYLYILLFNNDIVVKTNHRPTISNNTYTGYNGSEYKNTSIDFIIDGSNITDIQCTHFAIQLIGAGNSSSNIYIKDIELYLVDDFDMDDVVNRKSLIKKHINEFGVSNNLIFNANMKMNNINYSKTINTHTLVDSTNNSNLVSYNGKSAYYPTGTYSDISNPLIIDGEFTILYNVIFKKDKPASHVYTHFSIAENVINCNRNTDGILSFWMGGNPDHYHDQVVMNKQYTCAIVCRKNGDKFDYITIANDKRVETLENVKKITRLNVTINNDKDGETPSDFDEIEFSDLMIYDRGLSDEELYLQYDIVSGNKLHIRPNEIIAKKFSEGL